MPHLIVTLTSPKQTINTGFGTHKVSRIKLIGYSAQGLPDSQTLYFMIRNQAVTATYGNHGSPRFPLIFSKFPEDALYPNHPIHILKSNDAWTDSRQLDFEVSDSTGALATFTRLDLVFKVSEHFKQHKHYPGHQHTQPEGLPQSYFEGAKDFVRIADALSAHPFGRTF